MRMSANDIILFGCTIHLILRKLHLCDIESRKLQAIVSILRNEVTIVKYKVSNVRELS